MAVTKLTRILSNCHSPDALRLLESGYLNQQSQSPTVVMLDSPDSDPCHGRRRGRDSTASVTPVTVTVPGPFGPVPPADSGVTRMVAASGPRLSIIMPVSRMLASSQEA
jgi:hypothetical protein